MPSHPVTIRGVLTYDAPAPIPPDPPTGQRRLLTSADISFVGYLKFDLVLSDLWYAYAQFDFRTVDGQPRLLTIGNGSGHLEEMWPILEYALPTGDPHPDIAQAPVLTSICNYGSINAQLLTGGHPSQTLPGGLLWDERRQGVWWTYGDLYAPVDWCPTLGFATLTPPADGWYGTLTPYGPWRAAWHPEQTKGNMVRLPRAFSARRGMNGADVGLMASAHSASSPNGAVLHAGRLPDPFTAPPDVPFDSHLTVLGATCILHDLDHPQARDDRWQQCNWVERYDCAKGSTVTRGLPIFNGAEPGSSQEDMMSAAVWIDLPDTYGVLYFGQLVSTPPGVHLEHDADGLTHQWYGNCDHCTSASGQPKVCCHEQDDPWWITTGPGAHYRMAKGWIYDPQDFVGVVNGTVEPWGLTPKEEFWWGTDQRFPRAAERVPPGFFRNAKFDAATRRLYVGVHEVDHYNGKPRPALAVFEIR